MLSISVYLSVGVPASRTIASPLPEDTHEDRVEAMRVLSAGNTIMIVLLGLVLVLQVSPSTVSREGASDAKVADVHAPANACPAGRRGVRETCRGQGRRVGEAAGPQSRCIRWSGRD